MRKPLIKKNVLIEEQVNEEPEVERKSFPASVPADLMKGYDEFRSRIAIDKDKLDSAAEEQAQIFLEVAERHAHAINMRDSAKEGLANLSATLAKEVRDHLEKENKKSTEAIVQEMILTDERYKNQSYLYSKYRREAEQWSVLRDSFDQRMRMIRELVGLYASGYFTVSGSAAPRNAVRDALAATAKEKLAEQRRNRNSE